MANTTSPQPPKAAEDEVGPSNPDYIAFVLVPVFFFLGLLGVVICHVLKRKGYRCTTAQEEEETSKESVELEGGPETNETSNNDTVGQIVHYIMKNEANSDALKALVHENSVESDGISLTPTTPGPGTPPLSPFAPGGASQHTCNHLHTISGTAGIKNMCTRCTQKKWPMMKKPSVRRADASRSHHGEVTVLSVGRFRVTKTEKVQRHRRTLVVTDSNGIDPTSGQPEAQHADFHDIRQPCPDEGD